nr:MAG TPA: hypothetical protein [Caudoviricetes sp.]
MELACGKNYFPKPGKRSLCSPFNWPSDFSFGTFGRNPAKNPSQNIRFPCC